MVKCLEIKCVLFTEMKGNKLVDSEKVLANKLCKDRQAKDEEVVKCLHPVTTYME